MNTTEDMGRNKNVLNLKYVVIVATFRAGPDGMQDHLAGDLTKIQWVRIWSDPERPDRTGTN